MFLTASDRSSLLRFASSLPKGSEERRAILAGLSRVSDDKSFEDSVKGKKFKNPDTGNDVVFSSLPAEEQKKVREEWAKKNEDASTSKKLPPRRQKKLNDAFHVGFDYQRVAPNPTAGVLVELQQAAKSDEDQEAVKNKAKKILTSAGENPEDWDIEYRLHGNAGRLLVVPK